MPSRFDSEALHTAAATLPWAIEVKAMEDCTVDGNRQRNSSPTSSESGSTTAERVTQSEAEDGEQYEGGAEHDEMQAPMQRARQRRLARQPGAMQEEQQRDRKNGDVVQNRRADADRRQQARDNDSRDNGEREIVRPEGAKRTQQGNPPSPARFPRG